MNRSMVYFTRFGVVLAVALPASLGLFGSSRAQPPSPVQPQGAGADGVEVVAKLLKHQDAGTRAAAAEALGQMGAGAVKSLVSALADETPRVRVAAATALAKLGPDAKSALPAVAGRLGDGEKDEAARKALQEALVAITKQPDPRPGVGQAQPQPAGGAQPPPACHGCNNKGVVDCKHCKGKGEVPGVGYDNTPTLETCSKCKVFAQFGGTHTGILPKGKVPCYVCDGKRASAAAAPAEAPDRRKELTQRLTKLRTSEEFKQTKLETARKNLEASTKQYEESGGKIGDAELPKSAAAAAAVIRWTTGVFEAENELRDLRAEIREVQRQLDALRE